jgi:hypothetical protein
MRRSLMLRFFGGSVRLFGWLRSGLWWVGMGRP